MVLFGCLLYYDQVPLLRNHGKVREAPFFELLIVFFRVGKGYKMAQRPCNDILASFYGSGKILMAIQHPGNIPGYRRLFC